MIETPQHFVFRTNEKTTLYKVLSEGNKVVIETLHNTPMTFKNYVYRDVVYL